MDNDGWLDILMSNGHVYPEVDKSNADLKYAEHKYLYRNLQNGRFEEVTDKGGPGILENAPARGCAFGDYDNDGDIDIAVNCVNAIPQLLRCDSTLNRNWIKIKLVGVKSNRSGYRQPRYRDRQDQAGRAKPLAQMDELRSGGSYFSQNDLRMHFGLEQADQGRHRRDPLAQRPGGSAQRSGRQQALRDSGRRQDPERRNADARKAQGLNVRLGLLLLIAAVPLAADSCPWLNAATAGGVLGGPVTSATVKRTGTATMPPATLSATRAPRSPGCASKSKPCARRQ